MSDISDRVRNIVVEHLGVDAGKVVDGASFIVTAGLDAMLWHRENRMGLGVLEREPSWMRAAPWPLLESLRAQSCP